MQYDDNTAVYSLKKRTVCGSKSTESFLILRDAPTESYLLDLESVSALLRFSSNFSGVFSDSAPH